MRVATVVASLVFAFQLASTSSAFAEPPHPLARVTPPEGKFFDDPLAISNDGKWVALVATDAATESSLSLWDPSSTGPRITVDGLPATIVRTSFLSVDRLLVVYQTEDKRLSAALVTRRDQKLVLDKKRLGPADGIDAILRDGKPAIATYQKRARKVGAEHVVTLFSPDGKLLQKRAIVEDGEGLLRTRAGGVRPLWWSAGHTTLAAQKVGDYDKAKDMRRPDRFIRLDTLTDKVTAEQEIEDVMAFAKVGVAHKAQVDTETFVRPSDDHRQLLVTDGLVEQVVPLARPIDQYDMASISSVQLADHELLIKLQVDPNNAAAVNRRAQDPDDIDLYKLDLGSLKATPSAPRVMVIPGTGRPAGITASSTKLVLLRKARGYDRGGVAVELYTLP